MSVYLDFLTYKSGIYRADDNLPKFSNTHAIKIIGWGKEKIKKVFYKYWIIQNSWGEDWGENGYAKVFIGQDINIDTFAYSIDVNHKRYKNENKE